jgi:hypothetical protein
MCEIRPGPGLPTVPTDERTHVVMVVTRLLVIQYTPSPDGTFREKYPTMNGKKRRMNCDCCALGSSGFCHTPA